MREMNIWELGERINIKIKAGFLKDIKSRIKEKHRTKRSLYNSLNCKLSFKSFSNLLKEGHHNKWFVPLNIFLSICENVGINKYVLQENILAYKTSRGPNYIYNPILPIKITPIFDMITAHNIADGTVIDPKRGRKPYFGYRQFEPIVRELYVRKIESVFGKVHFAKEYFLRSTRSYCPTAVSIAFFDVYKLNSRSYLSETARIPTEILEKDKDHLLAVLLAFVIDEGSVDSTMISIRMKNVELTHDLYLICQKLDYKASFSVKNNYGFLNILRTGMRKLFEDYLNLLNKYPEVNLGKREQKIKQSFEIHNRSIFKTKGNKQIILKMLENEELTVNQIAARIKMTRQGARFHIHNLKKEDKVEITGKTTNGNLVYGAKC